ncbi:acyl CoA binding protein [Cooperia oncophora]
MSVGSLQIYTSHCMLHCPFILYYLQFDEAATKVKSLKASPSNDQLLELYALFKQGTVGDNNTDKPGMFDLKGKAKWSAWDGKKGSETLSIIVH